MGRANEDLLADLVRFCEEVAKHLEKVDIEDFQESITKQRAVERSLELIGEAATQLGSARPRIDVPWDKIMRLRVLLAHAYHKVDLLMLYETATNDVPELLRELLGSGGSPKPQK